LRLRLTVAGVALALVLAGTLWGSDDDFPAGPFRMYATAARTTGNVRTAQLYGVLASGEQRLLQAGDVGLRRAELEGQLPRFRAEPDLLSALARPEFVEVRLVERIRRVVDRRVQPGERFEVIAAWHR
jgi:hypothetical protein